MVDNNVLFYVKTITNVHNFKLFVKLLKLFTMNWKTLWGYCL